MWRTLILVLYCLWKSVYVEFLKTVYSIVLHFLLVQWGEEIQYFQQKFKLFPKFMKVWGHSWLILNVTDANAVNSSQISNGVIRFAVWYGPQKRHAWLLGFYEPFTCCLVYSMQWHMYCKCQVWLETHIFLNFYFKNRFVIYGGSEVSMGCCVSWVLRTWWYSSKSTLLINVPLSFSFKL